MKMSLDEVNNPLVLLVGATAVGKTELSLRLAEHLQGEIISCDARLFYRGMDIATAKPGIEERGRIAHHLIDIAQPDEHWSLALFLRAAYQAIDDIHCRGRLPIMTGGSGQYVQAIREGWQVPPHEPDALLRQTLSEWSEKIGAEALHNKLALLDPPAAASIDPRNVRRTIRALEVILRSGERFSSQRRKGAPRCPLLLIGLSRPRPVIFARVDARIEAMFAQGLLDEVRLLLEAGYTPDDPGMASIGYREAAAVLRGEMTMEDAKARMRQLTHQFVRRQANWFKHNDPGIHWFDLEQPGAWEDILQTIRFEGRWLLPAPDQQESE